MEKRDLILPGVTDRIQDPYLVRCDHRPSRCGTCRRDRRNYDKIMEFLRRLCRRRHHRILNVGLQLGYRV